MKISLNWIKEFVDIPAKYTARRLAELLTLRTCEVEGFEDEAAKFANMVVGRAEKIRAHPNADKLRLVDTDIGGRTVQIACGGENLYNGMLTAVALPGAMVKWHGENRFTELKTARIRGEESCGMICAEEEIGLPVLTPQKGIAIADLSYFFKSYGKPAAKPGTPLAAALGLDDVIFEIDNKSLTHRPDLWGHYGMAREFAAFLGKKLRPFVTRNTIVKTGDKVNVKIEKPEICARFLSAIITGIKTEESPMWLKNRLQAVGMRPVNNIVDATNYVMLELGHPLHAFDRRAVANDTFAIRFARKGEILETLDHKKRALSQEDALVTNGEKALGLAGVMGGLNSEISPRTTEIIIEAARWNPLLIRKTASRHFLRSDAAQRFEKALDPEITGMAFRRVCELILKLCPSAHLSGPVTDIYPKRAKSQSIPLSIETLNRKIGIQIKKNEIIKHLRALEFSVKKAAKGALKIEVPTHRALHDISMEDDLVEEVARMHGYENIKPQLPELPIKLPIENIERRRKHASREILSHILGMNEANLYSFYGNAEIRKCMLPEGAHIKIDNPITEDQTHLRISLMPNLLKAADVNIRSAKIVKLYEIGRTYMHGENYFPLEEKFIAGLIMRPESKREIFYDALGTLRAFLKQSGAPEFRVEEIASAPPYAHPAKCAAIMCDGKEIAAVYELHPQVLKNFDIKCATAGFEINFTRLAALGRKEYAFRPIPRFPDMEIDVSVLVPKKTQVREITEIIRAANQPHVSGIELHDVFENASFGANKKSFTLRITLQSPDRTLTDEEMKQTQEVIYKVLRDSGFVIR